MWKAVHIQTINSNPLTYVMIKIERKHVPLEGDKPLQMFRLFSSLGTLHNVKKKCN